MKYERKLSNTTRGILALSLFLGACEPVGATKTPKQDVLKPPSTEVVPFPTPTPHPSSTPVPPTPSPIPTLTKILATPTETLTPTPSHIETDAAIKYSIETARKGDLVVLENALISHVIKISRSNFGDANLGDIVLGVVSVKSVEGNKLLVVIENFDCQLKSLADSGELGDPIGPTDFLFATGVWAPHVRLDIYAKMVKEYSMGSIPWAISDKYTYQGQDITCPKESGFADLPPFFADQIIERIEKFQSERQK